MIVDGLGNRIFEITSFLMIGQSNMAGRGYVAEVEPRVVPSEMHLDTHQALLSAMFDRRLRYDVRCSYDEQQHQKKSSCHSVHLRLSLLFVIPLVCRFSLRIRTYMRAAHKRNLANLLPLIKLYNF